ncbi:peroxiredoxin [Mangrovibrevibacter kandeliae]|uniref:peroxiredoxin n=1 Tax=Mangrovibrevibacter kandeliae TaxID=2968473 RepID=UPI0021195728|nr:MULTISPECIES: peroxiredoxin [unclassified Aurantimonas]MCQ8782538.1 peroxiredoxin [Aurantimonas sp. CSK15Z-1]MCW4114653.1 peroxiredoxin [Aurantimonas sp. MSK8Z-1]
MPSPSIGEPCPEFALPDETGAIVSLASLRGRPFVLYLYPKDDTSGCTQEAIDFTALAPDFEAIGVPVIGVSPDSVKKHGKFKAKHELAVRLLADEEKALLQALGAWVEKSMYGRAYMGVERTTLLVDPQGLIRALWSKVKVPGHAAEVLAAARELAGAA